MNYEKFNDAMCRLRQAEEDLNKALRGVAVAINESESGILLEFTPEEIIDKTLEWKTKQKKEEKEDQELRVGDEIEYIRYGKLSEKRIVVKIDDRESDEKIIWTIGLDRFDQYGTSTNDPTEKYRKTGKHYDSIPLNTESK